MRAGLVHLPDIFAYDYVGPALGDAELGKCIKRAMFWQRMMYWYYTPHPAIQPTASFRTLKRWLCEMKPRAVRALFTPQGIADRHDD